MDTNTCQVITSLLPLSPHLLLFVLEHAGTSLLPIGVLQEVGTALSSLPLKLLLLLLHLFPQPLLFLLPCLFLFLSSQQHLAFVLAEVAILTLLPSEVLCHLDDGGTGVPTQTASLLLIFRVLLIVAVAVVVVAAAVVVVVAAGVSGTQPTATAPKGVASCSGGGGGCGCCIVRRYGRGCRCVCRRVMASFTPEELFKVLRGIDADGLIRLLKRHSWRVIAGRWCGQPR